MILLGSIQRLELIKLIERHIGRERRLQVAAKWQKEAQERWEEFIQPFLLCRCFVAEILSDIGHRKAQEQEWRGASWLINQGRWHEWGIQHTGEEKCWQNFDKETSRKRSCHVYRMIILKLNLEKYIFSYFQSWSVTAWLTLQWGQSEDNWSFVVWNIS